MKQYNPAEFWESRYQIFDITTSGHIDLPLAYNGWLYKMKTGKVAKLLDKYTGSMQDKKILELGCGTGAYISLWQERGVKELTGIDISQTSVATLKEKFPAYNFFCRDIADEELPSFLGVGKYDVITVIGVLVHIVHEEDMLSSLANIAGLAKTNGLVLISDYMLRGEQEARDGEYMKFRNLELFRQNLLDVGLEMVAQVPLYYFMIAPFDTPQAMQKWFLHKAHHALRKFIWKYPHGTGRILYYIDTLFTSLMKDGPSEELYLCRKI